MSFIQNRTWHHHNDEDHLITKRKQTFRGFICSKPMKGTILTILFSISVPVLIYYFIIDEGLYAAKETSTCLIERSYRVSCGHPNISYQECSKIHCCYSHNSKQCFHYMPSKYFYHRSNYSPSLEMTPLKTKALPKMYLYVLDRDEERVSVILRNSSMPVRPKDIVKHKKYNVDKSTDELIVEIYRAENGTKGDKIFSTAKGPLIATDGYWEWTFQISNDKLYGLDELLINVDENSTLTKVIYKNRFDHNSVPVFMGYEKGKFNGLIVKHDAPLEVTVLSSNLVILRSLGGTHIELELSVGPSPSDVFRQQQKQEYKVPPEWVLGLHLCRRDEFVEAESALDEYKEFLTNITDIPYESDCFHENLVMMIQQGKNLSELSARLQGMKSTKKLLLSLPPHLLMKNDSTLYNKTEALGILYKDPISNNGSAYRGSYLEETVVYPDYSSPSAQDFIDSLIQEIFVKNNIIPDGLILNDNWPADEKFMMDRINNKFPYLSEALIQAMSKTIPWNSTVDDIYHYMKHNDYGSSQMASVGKYFSSRNSSLFLMSASYNYNNRPAVVENMNISWTNLKKSIATVLSNCIFGNNFVSLPVCGSTAFFENKEMEELCLRWYLTAATMPLFQTSSEPPRRFPMNMYTKFAASHIIDIIDKRNQLIPHYYTLLQKNEPFLRPMFFDFFEDNNTLILDEQYMIGKNILVAQPLLPGKARIHVYLPPVVKVWYGFWDGRRYEVSRRKAWVNIDVVESDWVSFIAQGSIIPMVQKRENGTLLNLIVALDCTETPCSASDSLFAGEQYLTFGANETALTIDGISPSVKNYIGCDQNRTYSLNEVKIYQNSTVGYRHFKIDICNCTNTNVTVSLLTNSTNNSF